MTKILKTMHVQFLFVYGSLMRGASLDTHPLLAQHAAYVCAAMWQGRLYRVDYYPGAVKTQTVSDRVHGELYRLHEPGDLLARLDQYEECAPEFPEPTEYVRSKESVVIENGDSVRAWIYLYNWPLVKLERIESGDFRRGG
ncbi:gamma-glutamylcyclotransferase [Candidatus Methylospira mobilis]|uniref:Gamma-glutamylcyclotransferase n=1 Tax=Candidatus Methylospira mobilis TaxID=1808979 RepID=A0A5Q0BEM4_9GAMM|nr:gamma-glutamylcyclotransferase family protein [Candidatus Methylospira mobilis]QFY41959.1 gamma-glutamylcyclotransferase [Candidatus Methylospira mobilis]WNV02949.1 gamma-glutamylcyclotransferase family protein [Candidatus Methylospira mobilis]